LRKLADTAGVPSNLTGVRRASIASGIDVLPPIWKKRFIARLFTFSLLHKERTFGSISREAAERIGAYYVCAARRENAAARLF